MISGWNLLFLYRFFLEKNKSDLKWSFCLLFRHDAAPPFTVFNVVSLPKSSLQQSLMWNFICKHKHRFRLMFAPSLNRSRFICPSFFGFFHVLFYIIDVQWASSPVHIPGLWKAHQSMLGNHISPSNRIVYGHLVKRDRPEKESHVQTSDINIFVDPSTHTHLDRHHAYSRSPFCWWNRPFDGAYLFDGTAIIKPKNGEILLCVCVHVFGDCFWKDSDVEMNLKTDNKGIIIIIIYVMK